jgi:hypothetical protein
MILWHLFTTISACVSILVVLGINVLKYSLATGMGLHLILGKGD